MSRLNRLQLQRFRNHTTLDLRFDEPITVIVADNGHGKTSILEAVQLLATGESFRADRAEEMVQFDAELAQVVGQLSNDTVEQLEVMVTRGVVQGKRTQTRLYSVNQVRRRRKDFIGHFNCVVFRPEDMRLMEGSPSRRRNFLDTVLSQTHIQYAHSHSTYEQALLKRNKLLQAVRDGEMPSSVLTYWNLQLVKHGEVVQGHRQRFLETFGAVEFPTRFEIEYRPSLMTAERLAEYQPREIAAGHTLIGPHKDDFDVSFQWRPTDEWHSVSTFGSRGQQRLAVLWLKVAELEYVLGKTASRPLLALDDIFSELDPDVRTLVMSLIRRQQTIITTTEQRVVAELQAELGELQVVEL